MKTRNLIGVIVFLMVIASFTQFAYTQDEALNDTLKLLIKEALDNNPQIQSTYSAWKAAEYKIRSAKSLSNPTARYTYFGESIETRVGPQEHKYGVSQKVPFPGKRGLKGKARAKHAQMLKEKYEATKREIIRDVKFVYYDIFWVDKAIRVTEEEKAILESLEKVAQRRFESNSAPQQDAIKAQVELSKLIDKLYLFRQSRSSLVAKLNSILSRPQGTDFSNIPEIHASEFRYNLSELHELAKGSRQELLAAELDVERAEFEKSLAKLEYLPDLTLGFDYIEIGSGETMNPNDGDDAWMGTIAISVPIWFNKLNSQLNEKESALNATREAYKNVENKVGYQVEDLYVKIKTYKDIVSLYKTALLPQAEQSFDAAKIGYETGKIDFLNWLDAERMLLQIRLAYYKSIVDYQKSIAYLERVVGRDL